MVTYNLDKVFEIADRHYKELKDELELLQNPNIVKMISKKIVYKDRVKLYSERLVDKESYEDVMIIE